MKEQENWMHIALFNGNTDNLPKKENKTFYSNSKPAINFHDTKVQFFLEKYIITVNISHEILIKLFNIFHLLRIKMIILFCKK